MLGSLLLVITTAVAATPEPAGPPLDPARLVDDVERAVVIGDAQALRVSRQSLLTHLESTPEADTQTERYTLAYVNWSINHILEDAGGTMKERRALLVEAQSQLQVVVKNDPDDAEAHALLGSVIGEQIGASAWRGMTMGPRSGRAITRAYTLAPDNPRVALQRGISYLYTPRMFGGGLAKAEAELRRAVGLYENEDPDKAWPNWGRVEALAWLGQALAKKGEFEAAEAAYRRALELEPGHVWIRDVLVPALKER